MIRALEVHRSSARLAGTTALCACLGVALLVACKKGDGSGKEGKAECKLGEVKACHEQCEAGQTKACMTLGRSYQMGEPKFSIDKAAKAFLQACNRKHGAACMELSHLVDNPHFQSTYKPEVAKELRKKACAAGDQAACTQVIMTPFESPEDKERAFKAFEAGCSQGKQAFCTTVAWMHRSGHHVKEDRAKAHELYQEGCKKGDQEACTGVGVNYCSGWGVAEDKVKGKQYLERACAAGYTPACDELRKTLESSPADRKAKFELDQRACARFDSLACYYLGDAYAEGVDGVVGKDPKLAWKHLMQSCLLGLADSCKDADKLNQP